MFTGVIEFTTHDGCWNSREDDSDVFVEVWEVAIRRSFQTIDEAERWISCECEDAVNYLVMLDGRLYVELFGGQKIALPDRRYSVQISNYMCPKSMLKRPKIVMDGVQLRKEYVFRLPDGEPFTHICDLVYGAEAENGQTRRIGRL